MVSGGTRGAGLLLMIVGLGWVSVLLFAATVSPRTAPVS